MNQGTLRLATYSNTQPIARFLGSRAPSPLPDFWTPGQPGQCPVSDPLTSCFPAIPDADSPLRLSFQYSTSTCDGVSQSGLGGKVAIGLAPAPCRKPSAGAGKLGQEQKW